MKKTTEIKKEYIYNTKGFNFSKKDFIEETIEKIIKELQKHKINLKNPEIIEEKYTYFNDLDILESYNITIIKKETDENTIYELVEKVPSSIDFDITKKLEFKDYNSLEDYLKNILKIPIETLEEEKTLKVQRKKYIIDYLESKIELTFEETKDLNSSIEKNFNSISIKILKGKLEDLEEFCKIMNSFIFLVETSKSKIELLTNDFPIILRTYENFNSKIDEQEHQQLLEEYFKCNENVKKALEELNERKEYIKDLREKIGPLSRPIVVSVTGTPRAGKTTSIENLYDFFKKIGFKTENLEEPAHLVYKNLKTKEEKDELLKNRIEFVKSQYQIGLESINESLKNSEIILYDRGIIDPFIWYDLYYKLGMMSTNIYEEFLEKLKIQKSYYNYLYLLYTKSKEAMKRDYLNSLSLEQRSTMNEPTVRKYNASMLRLYPKFKEYTDSAILLDTTSFNRLDASIEIANDLIEKIENIYLRRRK